MRIFDTLSGKQEALVNARKRINIFVCGPTVYDAAHLGHARTYVFFDSAVKYLRSRGFDIFYLQNITDIDDKIIRRAAESHAAWDALAAKFAKSYLKDMKALGVTSVDQYAPATKFIPAIVAQVNMLIANGYAYKIADGWYFDISKFKDYGKLSRRTAEQAEDSVSRIDDSLGKRNKGDFCLWKFNRAGEPSWKTELGEGRPGWHIEDTAITENSFGPQYDIHGGGVDLKFPHHEAEIAQQEAASGRAPLARIWMHTGLLFVDGEKMSKSLGNFTTIEDFLKRESREVFRLMVLAHHYRSNMNYSDALLAQSASSLDSLQELLDKLQFASMSRKRRSGADRKVGEIIRSAEYEFTAAMEDDFNTPAALAAVFKFAGALNGVVWEIKPSEAKAALKSLLATLGFELIKLGYLRLRLCLLIFSLVFYLVRHIATQI